MASTANFEKGVKILNAQLWLLMASAENLQSIAHSLIPLQNRHLGTPSTRKPHSYETVLGTLMPGATKWRPKLHLRNHAFAEDLQVLAKDCEAWLPWYFLVLAKSLAEGHLIEELTARVDANKSIATNLTAFRKRSRNHRPSVKKAIETCVQGSVRGNYDDLDLVVSLANVRASLDKLTPALGSAATVRNHLAHRLAPHKAPTVTTRTLEDYVKNLTDLVVILSSVL
jgi:hypothetical protein